MTKSCMRGLGKSAAYAIDGSGRDSYINSNNGGLYKGSEFYTLDPGSFGLNYRRK